MRKFLIVALFAFVAFAFAQTNISVPDLSTNAVTVQEVQAHVSIWKDLVAGVKAGGWQFIVLNVGMILLLVIGSARLIARALELLLTFIVGLSPNNAAEQAWFTGKFLPAIHKFIAWTTDIFGFLSLTFGRKGTDVINNAKP